MRRPKMDFAISWAGSRAIVSLPKRKYWLGESLFQRQRYRDAAETFLTVSTSTKSTSRAPDALLRLGNRWRRWLTGSGLRLLWRGPAQISARFDKCEAEGVDREQKRVRC